MDRNRRIMTVQSFDDMNKDELFFAFGKNNLDTISEQLEYNITTLRRQENNRIMYVGNSPQIFMRKNIIEWLKEVADKYELLRKTVFHAVYLYDRFADSHDMSPRQIYLVALTCLFVAAKLGENESTTPTMKAMKSHLPLTTEYSKELFVAIEKMILKFFQWTIVSTTVADFVEYFIIFGVDEVDVQKDQNNNTISYEVDRSTSTMQEQNIENKPSDLERREAGARKCEENDLQMNQRHNKCELNEQENMSLPSQALLTVTTNLAKGISMSNIVESTVIEKVNRNFRRISRQATMNLMDQLIEILDDVLNAPPFEKYPPSLIAAAAIMLGRKKSKFSLWTEKLQQVTGYYESQVEECLNDYIVKLNMISSINEQVSICSKDTENKNNSEAKDQLQTETSDYA